MKHVVVDFPFHAASTGRLCPVTNRQNYGQRDYFRLMGQAGRSSLAKLTRAPVLFGSIQSESEAEYWLYPLPGRDGYRDGCAKEATQITKTLE